MKILLLRGLCVMFSVSSIAQEDTIVVPPSNLVVPDTLKGTGKKNEIGLNIGPILLVALGAAPYSQPVLGLTYKRVYGKWAFRTNFTLRILTDQDAWNERIVTIDSMYRVRSSSMERYYYTFRVGTEYRHQLRTRCWLVTGLDLQAQLFNLNRTTYQTAYPIQSIVNPGTANEHYITGSNGITTNLLEEKSREQSAGLGLTGGLMIPIGKRFWILGQCRLEVLFGPGQSTVKDNIAGTVKKSDYTAFYLDFGGALAEVYLFYRF